MAKINPKSITLVATFVSPGVAAGAAGFVIVGGKIKKVPPRGPASRSWRALWQRSQADPPAAGKRQAQYPLDAEAAASLVTAYAGRGAAA